MKTFKKALILGIFLTTSIAGAQQKDYEDFVANNRRTENEEKIVIEVPGRKEIIKIKSIFVKFDDNSDRDYFIKTIDGEEWMCPLRTHVYREKEYKHYEKITISVPNPYLPLDSRKH